MVGQDVLRKMAQCPLTKLPGYYIPTVGTPHHSIPGKVGAAKHSMKTMFNREVGDITEPD